MMEAEMTERKLMDKDQISEIVSANFMEQANELEPVGSYDHCNYQDCIIAMNKQLDRVIAIKKNQNRLEEKAKFVLESRLKASYGEVTGKVTGLKPVGQINSSLKHGQTKKGIINSSYMKELIEPCECGQKYHRICIREKIVSSMLKKCPECSAAYSVGFSDCYAMRNKRRPNYLAYMLV